MNKCVITSKLRTLHFLQDAAEDVKPMMADGLLRMSQHQQHGDGVARSAFGPPTSATSCCTYTTTTTAAGTVTTPTSGGAGGGGLASRRTRPEPLNLSQVSTVSNTCHGQ